MENREIILSMIQKERLKPSSTFIGHEGEHLVTTLRLNFLDDDAFNDFNVRLKFENSDGVFLSEDLSETGIFEVPHAVLKKGNVLCQVLFFTTEEVAEEDNPNGPMITKEKLRRESSIVAFKCGDTIAEDEVIVDPRKGLITFITDGDGNKYLSNDGKYHHIATKISEFDNDKGFMTEEEINTKIIATKTELKTLFIEVIGGKEPQSMIISDWEE